MTATELRKAEQNYQRAVARAETLRDVRNTKIRIALSEGWTHAAIAEATGLSRGRISQFKP